MNDILEKLIKKRLICCESNNIKLLTKKCRVVCMPDGTYYAADDFDGRFTNWLSKYNKQ